MVKAMVGVRVGGWVRGYKVGGQDNRLGLLV